MSEKVEVLGRLDTGMNIAAIRCDYGADEQQFVSSRKLST
jgi:hypothetical protein